MDNTTHEVTFTHDSREVAIAGLSDGDTIRVSLTRRKYVDGMAEPFVKTETYILCLKGKGFQLRGV